jgi:glycosyltransferase involved in cell wall biosynthesis
VDGRRPVFGYFGNLNPWKGVPVLLKAAQRLASSGIDGFELRLHGAAPFQTEKFVSEVDALLGETEPHVVPLGQYQREDIPSLMKDVDWVVMPSIWWENAPLVIQEAFLHRRPVIASNIGGMAEAVRDGVNGLHVRADDPSALAAAIRRAANNPGLWETMVSGIDTPPHIGEVADRHLGLYRTLSGKAEVISFKASAA